MKIEEFCPEAIDRAMLIGVMWGRSSTSLPVRGGTVIRPMTVRSRLALVIALGTAAASVLGVGPATAAARPGRHVLNGSQPRWLSRARATGGAPAAADQ